MTVRMHCPACGSDMRSRSLLSHYSLKPYRVCPDCHARYTSDAKTRKRQLWVAVLALASLAFLLAFAFRGGLWLLPAVLSQVVLWGYVGYALSKIRYVRYPD